jgi:hypothetical protein
MPECHGHPEEAFQNSVAPLGKGMPLPVEVRLAVNHFTTR